MHCLNKPPSLLLRNLRAITRIPHLIQWTTHALNTTTSPPTTISAEKTTPLPFQSLPGPTLIQNLKTIWREGIENFHNIIQEGFHKHGPIYNMTMPDNSSIVCVSDPDDFEHVFRADRSPSLRPNLLSSSSFYAQKGLSEGIQGNGESWIRHRSSMAPYLLRPIEIQPFASAICDVSDDSIALLKEGRNEDLIYHFYKWATESIAFVTFGFRIGVNLECPDEKALSFINAAYEFFHAESELMLSLPIHKFFKTPTLKRLYRAMGTMWDITNDYIEKSKNEAMSSLEPKGKPYVQKLANENRHELSKDEITQVVISLFSAGVDTTAVSAVNVLYHLSNFPAVQEKLHEEIQSVLPNHEKPTHRELAKMPYLTAVIKESLRVTPTFPGTIRQIREPIVLSGYEIPAETIIHLAFIKSKAVARRIYGDFENFRPERWLRKSTALHPFASFPFGIGARMCVGRRVAVMEISLFLVRLLQRFEIQHSDLEEDKLKRKFRMVVEPDRPFNLTLKNRT